MKRREFLGSALVGATTAACAESRAAPLGPGVPPIASARGSASSRFWATWGDGKAELSGYRTTSVRYGSARSAELVLIYVTEPHDRATRIKADNPKPDAAQVLKLNISEKFLTGLYPYSVMTSVFAPVDPLPGERFQPSKITLSAQEWCGHVYNGLWPLAGGARVRGFSYFESEGEEDRVMAVPDDALYEDGLLIQLRELDGPFLGGAARWSGALVPSLWRQRKAHVPLAPERATITRETRDGAVYFTLKSGDHEATYEVEDSGARRVRAWRTGDGSTAELIKTARLPYWGLHNPGDEVHRAELGLPTTG